MSDDLHSLTGAYVMDALDDDERIRFETFMATSPATAAEVASLREAVSALASGATMTPPEGMRAAVLSRVDVQRQDRPVLPERQVSTVTSLPTAEARPARSAWMARLTMGAAAVAVAISAGLGLTVVNLSGEVDELVAHSDQLASVLVAEDSTRHSTTLPRGGMLTAVTSTSHGTGVVLASDLEILDGNLMYALWGISAGVPVPIGELVDGHALTLAAADFDALGVTIEPVGELVAPTSAVIATLPA